MDSNPIWTPAASATASTESLKSAPSAAAPTAEKPANNQTISSETQTEGTNTPTSPGRTDKSFVGRGSSEGRGRHPNNFQRGGRGHDRGNRQGKKRDLGRNEWSKDKGDRRGRGRNADSHDSATKRQKLSDGTAKPLPVYATKFSEEELKDEERRPKKKVAVLLGYSGTGYKGMQFASDQKTIEGDLFQAFVAAGAISKANADDPKKSSFVRCARTDKGVHAAGNVISLKLIVEDEDIVQRINNKLAPQIRIWGFERTSNSFSAYQMVDSRIYEYLIPTHSFLPPHPSSFLGRKCEEWAATKNDTEAWEQRQREVDGYWEKIDAEVIEPILADYDQDVRIILEKALWLRAEEEAAAVGDDNERSDPNSGDAVADIKQPESSSMWANMTLEEKKARSNLLNEGIKKLRQAYITAKRSYRIDPTRLQRVRDALNTYVGVRNYHNYTVQKTFRDPSAKRIIKSFVVHGDPLIINGTEWLSLKVHGQSFMMHQIRKMVGMAALMVRCGCDPKQRIIESYGKDKISIPKAPSLGLLLERPVFDSYNKKATNELSKNGIDFEKYEKEMDEFKQREIYDRMHVDEEKENFFGNFFNHIDNFPSETFLFVTSGGIEATTIKVQDVSNMSVKGKAENADAELEDDGEEADDTKEDGAGNEG